MISYKKCSGCEYFHVGHSGMECTATFECVHRTGRKPFYADRARGYRTPEDGIMANVEYRGRVDEQF